MITRVKPQRWISPEKQRVGEPPKMQSERMGRVRAHPRNHGITPIRQRRPITRVQNTVLVSYDTFLERWLQHHALELVPRMHIKYCTCTHKWLLALTYDKPQNTASTIELIMYFPNSTAERRQIFIHSSTQVWVTCGGTYSFIHTSQRHLRQLPDAYIFPSTQVWATCTMTYFWKSRLCRLFLDMKHRTSTMSPYSEYDRPYGILPTWHSDIDNIWTSQTDYLMLKLR